MPATMYGDRGFYMRNCSLPLLKGDGKTRSEGNHTRVKEQRDHA